MKRLNTVDDYREAWCLQDAGNGWIAYRKELDYWCPSDVIGFDRDAMDGGVSSMSDTETHLAGFLYAIQPNKEEPDLSDMYEYAARKGLSIVGETGSCSRSPATADMLSHEAYLLEDAEAGDLWARLREENRLQYALLVFCLHRQKWAKKWVQMTNGILLELDKHRLDMSRLRTLQRIDPLSIERAQEYKAAAARVPKRLLGTLRHLEGAASRESAMSSTARTAIEQELVEYRSFLEEYEQRRKRRFETLAKHHFETLAGPFKNLLEESRGRPSLRNLARRVSKAVFVELTDEFIYSHDISIGKSTLLAAQITSLLFPKERITTRTTPFQKTYGKNALNEYKYAKESLPSV